MIRERLCQDCGKRFPQPTGPWVDALLCVHCGSDETIGIPDVDREADDLAALLGEQS